jgi:hypothetical protein
MRRVGVERVAPVGRFGGWRPFASVTQLIHRRDA